jgi:dienelactone hydrolase
VRERLFAAVLAVAFVTASAGCSAGSAASPDGPTAPRTATPTSDTLSRHPVGVLGSFWVGQRWLRLREPAHRGVTGARLGRRMLLTQVLYPALTKPTRLTPPAKGPFPMIAFAPGFMQCGGPYTKMLRSWASAGYVVVVVNFPKSDCKVGAAATESDLVNQPGDMSYAIGRMLKLDAGANGPFAGLIAQREIAVAGQSDGGDTVAAIAANTCCLDHRVVAIAVLSGSQWPPMPGRYFTRRPAPMLFTQGTADTINWPGCSVAMYRADRARARFYLNLFGANHTRPYWGVNRYERVVVRVGLAFFNRFVLGRLSARAAMRRAGDISNVAALYQGGAGPLRRGPCND